MITRFLLRLWCVYGVFSWGHQWVRDPEDTEGLVWWCRDCGTGGRQIVDFCGRKAVIEK